MAFTPGIFSAALVSTLTTLQFAYGDRTIMPNSIPGRFTSYVYLAWPDTFSGESTREIRLPIRVRCSAAGHRYSGMVTLPSALPARSLRGFRHTFRSGKDFHLVRAGCHQVMDVGAYRGMLCRKRQIRACRIRTGRRRGQRKPAGWDAACPPASKIQP